MATSGDRASCSNCGDPDFDKGDGAPDGDGGWLCPNCAEGAQAAAADDWERFCLWRVAPFEGD